MHTNNRGKQLAQILLIQADSSLYQVTGKSEIECKLYWEDMMLCCTMTKATFSERK